MNRYLQPVLFELIVINQPFMNRCHLKLITLNLQRMFLRQDTWHTGDYYWIRNQHPFMWALMAIYFDCGLITLMQLCHPMIW